MTRSDRITITWLVKPLYFI